MNVDSGRAVSRRRFLIGCATAAVALEFRPRTVEASRRELDDARAYLREHFVADLHAHPSLKTYFFKKHFGMRHPASRHTWPFTLRTDGPSLLKGGVDAVVASAYVPEPELREDCAPLSLAAALQPSLGRLARSMRMPSDETALAMLGQFESALARKDAAPFARIAKSPQDIETIRSEGKIAILHAVEGGHALNGKIENVDAFHARGVCMITLAHYYDAEVAGNIMGVPYRKFYDTMHCFREQYALESNRDKLHPFGRDVVERMLELGLLIDATHATPEARADIYELVGTRAPVVMSHVGVREMADYRMNPDPREIKRVAETGGVIGVIFLPFFLTGKHRGNAVDDIVDTVDHLIKYGGEDCVGWGSDFDGFTNPPNDLKEPADLPNLVDRLLKRFRPRVVEKIIGGNARRVLNDGWRPVP